VLPEPCLDIAPYKAQLQSQGWAVVPGVALDADNAALIALGRSLGEVSAQGNHHGAPNLENLGVNRVEAMEQPLRDGAGNEVFSSNAALFPLHTDNSFSAQPVRYVLMHCWQADPVGGESWVAHVDDMLALCDGDLVQRLHSTVYPTPFGQATVLGTREPGQTTIRFNCRDMHSFAKIRKAPLSQQASSDLVTLEAAAMQCLQRVQLRAGDCIVADNHRVLHGRSAFSPGSGRLLKRLRIQ
jgi:alpha-ketoglutarate-dependent taurine dioxygenase